MSSAQLRVPSVTARFNISEQGKSETIRLAMRKPITLPILKQIMQSFTHITATAYRSKLLSAMSSLAFFAFLSIGEITVNTSDHSNLTSFTQLERLVDSQQQIKALQLTLFHYKHSDSEGHPFVIYIYLQGRGVLSNDNHFRFCFSQRTNLWSVILLARWFAH